MILPSVNYVLPNPEWRHPRWLIGAKNAAIATTAQPIKVVR